jgi:hypothetical protein
MSDDASFRRAHRPIFLSFLFLSLAIVVSVAVFILVQYAFVTEKKSMDNEVKKEQNG